MEADLTQNALKVLEKRYLTKDKNGNVIESPQEMFERVAYHIASADKAYGKTDEEIKNIEKCFYNMMSSLEFVPNSPTLMNAGRPLGQLSACFVLPIDDSINSIFETLRAAALIHKSGGGTGFDFSRLRPRNSRVRSTDGVSSGPISFMKVYNAATQEIKQGGRRRGANMGILRVDHPEILDFITSKDDNKEITNFNISIALTDEFMKQVEEDGEYDLIDPHTHKAVKQLKAREVFDLIVNQAWKNGEPGIVFIDQINKDNPTPNIGRIESTNPCITADSWIMTTNGPRQVAELIGRKFSAVVNGRKWDSSENGFFETGIKDVYKLNTKEGFELRLTKEHPVMKIKTISRYKIITEWVKAEELKSGDKIIVNDHREFDGWSGKYTEKEGYLIGLLLGDGTMVGDTPVLSSWGDDDGVKAVRSLAYEYANGFSHRADFLGWSNIQRRNEFRLSTGYVKKIARELGLYAGRKVITETMERASSSFYKGLLKGLFDADGSVQGSQLKGVSIRLAQSDLDMLKAVQRMLLRLGIFSRIYSDRRNKTTAMLPDGKGGVKEYPIKPQHELVISNQNIIGFFEKVGFGDSSKMGKLRNNIENYRRKMNRERFVATIEALTLNGRERVFDVQIPGANAFDANGICVHNCGEQPLLPYESCNLGSINLSKMVKKEGGKYVVDWEKLRKTTHLAVHFLDNVIDKNQFPLPEIEKQTKLTRKIGLGVMGWADMLVILGIGYNSDEAVELAGETMGFILNEAIVKSQELAEEKGVFPAYEGSIWHQKGIRMRNATLTTIAPTGTISIISSCSSGIEPLFALVYTRHVMDDDRLLKVNPYFEKEAKKRGFYSEELMKKIEEEGSCAHIKEVPEDVKNVFVTAHDISPDWHIKMQAVFQRYVHNATSKTVNFSNQASVEDVKEAYLLAYKLGCKGITIYRDKSREEQVINIGDTTSQSEKTDSTQKGFKITPRPRPQVVRGTTTKVMTGCGTLYVTINEDEYNQPFEVFMQMGKAGGCAASQLEAIGRLVSMSFRAGVDTKEIITQLRGIRCPAPSWEKGGTRIFSCADAIAKVIDERMREKEEKGELQPQEVRMPVYIKGKNIVGVCPDCGNALLHEEGCLKCMSCGYSKC